MLDSEGCDCGNPSPANARTVARYRTSTGLPISVSICVAAPPAVSRWHTEVPISTEWLTVHPSPIAADADSILINLHIFEIGVTNAVVYNAGAAPTRPPSLSVLPPCHLILHGEDEERQQMISPKGRYLKNCSIDLLHCGGNMEFVVAYLKLKVDQVVEAELCVLRCAGWELRRLPVRHGMVKGDDLWGLLGWQPDAAVVAVGGRYLCWGDLSHGVVLWDALADDPELQYVSLPLAEPLRRRRGSGERYAIYMRSRSLCVTGEAALKFVDVAPRCCCGGLGVRQCSRSKYAFKSERGA
jgi:hypothetical protein